MADVREFVLRINGLGVHVAEWPSHRDSGGGNGGPHPAILFLHGFTGSNENWRPIWQRLAESLPWACTCFAPDIVGHGRTDAPQSPDRYRMEAAVEDLAALTRNLGADRVHLVGYSMGGRLALQYAAAYPERVQRLALEGASPGIDDPTAREERIQRDFELAAWIEANGVEAFVARWESLPLFAGQERLPRAIRAAQRRQRLNNRAHGLANSLRGMGAGAQRSLWRELGRIGVDTLLIAGEGDEKYCAIAHEMRSLLARADVAIAPGAGHNVHLESPDFFVAAVARFLSDGQ